MIGMKGIGNMALRNRAIAVVAIAFTAFVALHFWDRGERVRTEQGAFSGVADPAALRQAVPAFETVRADAMTPTKSPFFVKGGRGKAEGGRGDCKWAIANGKSQNERDSLLNIDSPQDIPPSPFPLPPSCIQLCQGYGPPCRGCSDDCSSCANRCQGWESARSMEWQAYAQGEYVGHARTAHVSEYRLRVDDQLDMIYRVTRQEQPNPYRLNVGDEISVESFTDGELNRNLLIQPDGTITLRLLGQVHATGRTVTQLRDTLEELYKKYYKVPAITVTPLKVNTKLEDLRATVDRRAGVGGQSQLVRVTPEGTISLPAIGSVHVQGLTLGEVQKELNERYWQEVEGIEVIPVLAQRAPRFVYVLGEVKNPGRFEMTGPTTAIQALSMAGSWNNGANLRQIVVFRRGDDWRLMATMINLEAALYGKQAHPCGEIWLDDSDVIIVPKSAILRADDFIDLVFTRGIYGVFPMTGNLNFSKLSTL
jgi:polysaccharide biosynthesis/export protein